MKQIITLFSALIFLGSSLFAQEAIKKKEMKEKFRLVIQFVSKGSGIDHKTKEKIDKFIEKQTVKPNYETCVWGKEGEVDYCFQLKEMKHHEQKKFVEEINKLISDKEMVHVEEEFKLDRKCRL